MSQLDILMERFAQIEERRVEADMRRAQALEVGLQSIALAIRDVGAMIVNNK